LKSNKNTVVGDPKVTRVGGVNFLLPGRPHLPPCCAVVGAEIVKRTGLPLRSVFIFRSPTHNSRKHVVEKGTVFLLRCSVGYDSHLHHHSPDHDLPSVFKS
jgi:hypothetical protein